MDKFPTHHNVPECLVEGAYVKEEPGVNNGSDLGVLWVEFFSGLTTVDRAKVSGDGTGLGHNEAVVNQGRHGVLKINRQSSLLYTSNLKVLAMIDQDIPSSRIKGHEDVYILCNYLRGH